jgi:hypothetical protein
LRHNAIGRLHAELLWLERYVDCLVHAGDRIAAIVNYDEWFEAPDRIAGQLTTTLRLEPANDSADLSTKIRAIVAAELRHCTSTVDDFMLPLTKPLYAALLNGNADDRAAVAERARTSFSLCGYAAEYVISKIEDTLALEEQAAFAAAPTARRASVGPTISTNVLVVGKAIRGFTEIVTRGKISGWAFDRTNPDDYLIVELFVGSNKRRVSEARRNRPTAQAVFGRNDYGFEFNLVRKLEPGELEQVAVYAVSASGARVLLPRFKSAPPQ